MSKKIVYECGIYEFDTEREAIAHGEFYEKDVYKATYRWIENFNSDVNDTECYWELLNLELIYENQKNTD